jgi:NitT/TauT family transport system substrate-binding protein
MKTSGSTPRSTPILVILVIVLVLTLAAAAGAGFPGNVQAADTISFGVLPVIQALPLFVAKEKGFFAEEGLDVDLIRFQSGLEKDAAMAAGQTQGYFGDMLTSITLDANQIPVRMVATVYNTTGGERMFAVLAGPGKGDLSLGQLAEMGIAGSSNTIIEYVTRHLIESRAPEARLKLIEVKNILHRVPMLLEGQVAGAVLPEPLVTLVESRGATVIADDRGSGITPTVLIFRQDFLKDRPEDARGFLRAVTRASVLIGEDPEAIREVMIRNTRIPEPLQQSFAVPAFGPPTVPRRDLVMDTYQWLKERGVLKSELGFGEMVQGGLLP